MSLYLAYQSTEALRCVFYTVVERNRALQKKYSGGLKGFLARYHCRCNGYFSVACYMGSDVDDTVEDLIENGLKAWEDFICFNALMYLPLWLVDSDQSGQPQYVDLGVE